MYGFLIYVCIAIPAIVAFWAYGAEIHWPSVLLMWYFSIAYDISKALS